MTITKKTKNCVVCFKPAVMFTGHVKRGPESVIAGWCKKHWERPIGFCGHYVSKMKLQEYE